MKGPQGLAGKSCERRCRTANSLRRWVRGRFPLLSSEIAGPPTGGNDDHAGAWHIRRSACGVTPASDVTHTMQTKANLGTTGVLPGLVTRSSTHGRSRSTNSVGEWPASRSSRDARRAARRETAARQWLSRSGPGWCPVRYRTRKRGRGVNNQLGDVADGLSYFFIFFDGPSVSLAGLRTWS